VPPHAREYVDIALRNIAQLSTMIGDLLEITRAEAGKLRVDPETIPLSDILEEAVASACPSAALRNIALDRDLGTALPMVTADRGRVRQIVTNLLDNAIKFTQQGGAITVTAGMDARSPGFVRVSVTDTGCGLEPDDMQKVFDRHYQVPNRDCAARKGLGLGLCICKELVTRQGGEIQVKSQPNVGSDFSFTLPIFSVSSLVGPILSRHPKTAQIVVHSVEIPSRGSDSDLEGVASAREIVQRCLLPDLDAMLPASYPTPRGRMFVVIAATDDRGARVMSKRIADQALGQPIRMRKASRGSRTPSSDVAVPAGPPRVIEF
jgi:anti-sigma regulatory factor (Ser/Thr protein kinase)